MTRTPLRSKTDVEPNGDTGLARLRNEVDNLFDRFLGGWGTRAMESWPARLGWGPRLDLAETDDEITVKVELPGVNPADVEVGVNEGLLTIRGEKKQEHEEKKHDYHCIEREYGTFSRTVQLPGTVDRDKVDASFKDGILTIRMAKRADAKPKRVKIRTTPEA